jgi:hypothetical protein
MRLTARTVVATLWLPLTVIACSDDPAGPAPLAAPTGVTVQATGPRTARVTFTAVTGASGYVVERAAGTAGFATAGTTATTSFDDSGLNPSTAYRYRVAATRGTDVSSFSSEATATTPAEGPKVATINADITASRTLFADTTYTLTGFIHVANGATLTIQPGTTILGDANVLGSALFILRGARIIAKGTATQPIVFTSSRAAGQRQPGDWGGLIIVGNGVINRSGNIQLEGTGPAGTTGNYQVLYSGGTNNADNSGELEYVRIEFAGFAPAQNQELNSLTLAAVGSGTRIQYVQTLAGLDDSFEWFGGAVDAKYLISYESGDDHFDMSEGYVGRLQYLIGYQTKVLTPRAGAGGVSSDPQGIENDGCDAAAAGCDQGHASTPRNVPVVANFTLIGRGDAATMSTGGDIGMVIRRGTGGYYVNGVLGRWPRAGISVRDAATQTMITNGDLMLSNIFVSEAPVIYQSGQQTGADTTANALRMLPATTASLFASVPTAPTSAAQIDWTPSSTAVIRTGGIAAFSGKLQTAAGTFVSGTSFLGAVDPTGPKWWVGWTNYAVN